MHRQFSLIISGPNSFGLKSRFNETYKSIYFTLLIYEVSTFLTRVSGRTDGRTTPCCSRKILIRLNLSVSSKIYSDRLTSNISSVSYIKILANSPSSLPGTSMYYVYDSTLGSLWFNSKHVHHNVTS